MHELQAYPASLFLTLTYDNEHLPLDRGLRPEDYTLFMKRLRKGVEQRIKYFQCGEYGELTQRPHHHAIIFGYWPEDARRVPGRSEHPFFSSRSLDECWGQGATRFGVATFETAAYVARYVTKKVTGALAPAHYNGRHPEYMTCSRGIGERWLERYDVQTYKDDFIIANGKRQPVPRYYDKKFSERSPRKFRKVQLDRIAAGNTAKQRWNRTEDRLRVREEVARAQLEIKRRDLE